ERAAPVQSLAGEHAGEFVAQLLVHAEEIADLAAADADVARRHIGVGTDVAEEFRHERLAETHDLRVALPLGIEVGAAFAAAHRQRRQTVLEDLFEGEELEDAEVDGWMKAEAAFVGAERAVHLDAEAAIDADFAAVVDPRDAKHDQPLRLDHPLENFRG